MAQNNKNNKNKQTKPHQQQQQSGKKHTQDKSTQKRKNAAGKKKSSCCKWFLGSILLVALIGAAITYDTNVNGKGIFAKSATGKILKDAGMLPYVETAWYATMSTLARAYKWSEQHIPPIAKPAIALLCDLFKLFRNSACQLLTMIKDLIATKWPVVANFLEQYVPGLPQKLELFTLSVKNVFVEASVKFVSFIKENVLVGSLSPENLSKALNQSQNAALEYLNIFNKKVDAYAKLK